MDSNNLRHFKKWFSDYVAGYFGDDPVRNQPLRVKQEHTERVCNEIVMLGRAMDLPPGDILLAETMALFHDIGRFEQYAVYGTFRDASSEDHARLGLKELARHRVLSICSGPEVSIITKTIGYHNLLTLPKDEDERILFFARLLRDADKLDIWRVFIDYYKKQDEQPNSTIVWGLPNKENCSPKIMDAIRRKEMGQTKDMATLNDYKLVNISWVFDLNFRPTFRAVSKREYIETIAATLPQTREIELLVQVVLAYLEKHKSGK